MGVQGAIQFVTVLLDFMLQPYIHKGCCSVLQCVAVCCSVLQCVQCVAVCSVCCSVLQGAIQFVTVLLDSMLQLYIHKGCCSVLQCSSI